MNTTVSPAGNDPGAFPAPAGSALSSAPATRKDGPAESETAFIEQLRGLRTGELATLKRNAGNTLNEARNCFWFWRLLDADARGRDREIFFLVATLYASNKKASSGDFGQCMWRMSTKPGVNRDAIQRRFLVLLDADFDQAEGGIPAGGELAFRLRQLVKLAASREVGVDWPQLLHDLRQWRRPGRIIQKRWAASFFPAAGAAPGEEAAPPPPA